MNFLGWSVHDADQMGPLIERDGARRLGALFVGVVSTTGTAAFHGEGKDLSFTDSDKPTLPIAGAVSEIRRNQGIIYGEGLGPLYAMELESEPASAPPQDMSRTQGADSKRNQREEDTTHDILLHNRYKDLI